VIVAEGGLSRAFTEAARDFEAETGATVEIITYPYDEARQKQLLELSAGTGQLDAVLVDGEIWLTELEQYLQPIDEGAVSVDFGRFVESMPPMFQVDGTSYALPFRVGGWVLIYRRDLFEQAGIDSTPTTWADFRDAAQQLTRDGRYGFSAPLAQSNFLVAQWLPMLWSFGGELLSDDRQQAAFNSPAGIEATQFLVDLYKDGLVPPGAIEADHDGVITAMQQGQAAMALTYSPYLLEMNNPEKSEFAGQFAVAATIPIKEGSGLEAGRTLLAGWGVAVAKNSDNKAGAWSLAEYLTRDDVQKTLAVEHGNAPTVESVYRDRDYQAVYGGAEQVLEALRSASTRPGVPAWTRVEEQLALRLSEAVTGTRTVEEALAEAESDVNRLLAE
jgi:multiple sugar transport system substrate-binding protein